jgi:hypothetical protein
MRPNQSQVGVRTPGFERLEARLLSLGGESVVAQPEGDLDILLERGRVFKPRGTRLVQGEPHRCHRNVALHYAHFYHLGCGGRCHVVTGYGLNQGVWWQHSWAWDGSRILETTDRKQLYFGVVLNDREAARFVFAQLMAVLPGSAELFGGA